MLMTPVFSDKRSYSNKAVHALLLACWTALTLFDPVALKLMTISRTQMDASLKWLYGWNIALALWRSCTVMPLLIVSSSEGSVENLCFGLDFQHLPQDLENSMHYKQCFNSLFKVSVFDYHINMYTKNQYSMFDRTKLKMQTRKIIYNRFLRNMQLRF